MLAILSNLSFSRPHAALSLRRNLCYTVRKSAEGWLIHGAQTGICRVLHAIRRKAHFRCPGAQGHRHRRVHRGLQGRQLCQRRQRALLPHPVHILLRAVEVDGVLRDKYVRQTRREIDEGTVREMYEDGFPEPKSKPFTYVDDEYAERTIRCSRTYYEYAKGICENYRMDLRRYKLIREQKQYIGISNREAYQAMCEDLAFAQQSLKTVLNDYADLFRKRFSEELSIRKAADAMQQNRGVIERRQAVLYRAFAQLLQQRDEADGVCRLMQKIEYDQRDIEDLLE